MSKEPETAEQINTDKLLLWINRYLTRRFIADPIMLPDDECSKEAKVIFDKCREQIRQQVIEEIDPHIEMPCIESLGIDRLYNLKDCLGYINCGARNHCTWFWWQQFKRGE